MSTMTYDIQSYVEKVKNNEINLSEQLAKHLAYAENEQALLNDYISIVSEEQLAEDIHKVEQLDDASLKGVPLSIKDNILMAGLPMTCASKMLANFDKPLYTATAVERLEKAGAVILGKANLDEFAMGSNGETSYFGPTKNAYNQTLIPGGSSSGSAVSVAAGSVMGSLGTDTGGSVRQPASFNNVVGLKPTYGRVSRFGATAFASSLDQIGVFSKTIKDNAKILEVIAGHDPLDTTSSKIEVPAYSENLQVSLEGKKIAVISEYMNEAIHPEIRAKIETALDVYRNLGAIVETISIKNLEYVVPTYYILASAEASSNLAKFDGLHYGYRAEGHIEPEKIMKYSRVEGFGKEVKKRLMLGTYYLSHEAYNDYYLQAAKMRRVITEEYNAVLEKYDVIVGPTTPVLPKKLGEKLEDDNADYLNDLCTIPANLVGLPALSVPAGFTDEGYPVGLQIVGRAFEEETIYQFAYAFEEETKYYEVEPACMATLKGEQK